MRILQVLPHLSKGGAERVVVELSNSLIEAGHEVTLLLAFPVNPVLNQQYLDKRIKVQFASPKSGNRGLAYLKLPFRIVRDWNVLKSYDAIHCHLTFGLIFGFFIFCFRKITRTRNLRVIATCHVVGIGISRTRRLMNERLSGFFDVFVLMAQDDQWRNFIAAKKRVNFQIVLNGISANIWANRLKQPIRKPFWTVGTISRLQAERKPWLFLEVFSHVNDLMNGKVHFILGGEGPEKETLSALSEKLNLSQILSMPGLVQDPKSLLEDLDLYVGLNVEEITGIAGLEAVFSGVPVIGIQLVPSYVEGAKDWIWSSQNPIFIAERIVEYLENSTQLSMLAEEQYKVATQRFSVECMRDSYLSLYRTNK
jgi:glycosyltransferase involved in cell wall biosynthesis